ncbi:class C beta-lactamase [Undibacterium sp. Di27W]|uniref:class C beta-lactamase n=1 Tax=Undibacterium sp. Di27W TaxID=3413036 RepID=UPI003BF00462
MTSPAMQYLRIGVLLGSAILSLPAASAEVDTVKRATDAAILPVMKTHDIPGMAVGIFVDGKQYVYNYGLASRAENKAVTNATLFEVGSISKTFAATMATLAQVRGKLALSDKVADHIDSLQGSAFGETTVISLATHTTGGLPLQVPDEVNSDEQLMTYFKNWKPAHDQGLYRTYSNLSAGVLGVIAAKSLQQPFATVMQEQIFPAFGMHNSYMVVPEAKWADYAQGYKKDDTPVRLRDDVLSIEAYSVKTTASDLLQFIKANVGEMKLSPEFAQALNDTHTGYFKAGRMTQSLMWELYPYPANMSALLEGSSDRMVFEATPVQKIKPLIASQTKVFIHKTGATSGFGAYIAFIPHKKMGIVILANKSYPNAARIKIAQEILGELDK